MIFLVRRVAMMLPVHEAYNNLNAISESPPKAKITAAWKLPQLNSFP